MPAKKGKYSYFLSSVHRWKNHNLNWLRTKDFIKKIKDDFTSNTTLIGSNAKAGTSRTTGLSIDPIYIVNLDVTITPDECRILRNSVEEMAAANPTRKTICQLSSGDPSPIENMDAAEVQKFVVGLIHRLKFHAETNPEDAILCEGLVDKLRREEATTAAAAKTAKKKKDVEEEEEEDDEDDEEAAVVSKKAPTKRGRAKPKSSPYIITEAVEVDGDTDDSLDLESESSGEESELSEDDVDEEDFQLVPTSTKLGKSK